MQIVFESMTYSTNIHQEQSSSEKRCTMASNSVTQTMERLLQSPSGAPVSPSDFSIEHILNRAGKRSSNQDIHHPYRPRIQPNHREPALILQNDRKGLSTFAAVPTYEWTQFTRYRPPRPQQKLTKAQPAKRTPGRLPRVPFSTHQLLALETAYKASTYLSAEEAIRLAESLDLTDTRVKIWFQNRRARERREQRELDVPTTISNTPSPKHISEDSSFTPLNAEYGSASYSPNSTPPITSMDLKYYSLRPVSIRSLKPY